MSKTIKTTSNDSCTISVRGGTLPVVPVGTKVTVTLDDGKSVSFKSGYSTVSQLCATKGDKSLFLLLSPGFIKGQVQNVEISIEE